MAHLMVVQGTMEDIMEEAETEEVASVVGNIVEDRIAVTITLEVILLEEEIIQGEDLAPLATVDQSETK